MLIDKTDFWSLTRKKMEKEESLDNFKNWKTVRDIPLYGVGHFYYFPYEREVLDYLERKNPLAKIIWKNALIEPKRGHTKESYENALLHFSCANHHITASGWTIKTAHHIMTYESMSQKSLLEYDQIIEIGPGIGETARMIFDLGFQGSYHILDLPEIYRISSYYLSDYPGVYFHQHYHSIPQKRSLLMGTWSLSELPLAYRDEIIDYFKGYVDFFILYQSKIFEFDNQCYFEEYFPKRSGLKCQFRDIPEWPDKYLLAQIE